MKRSELFWNLVAVGAVALITMLNVFMFKMTDMKATLPMPPDGQAMRIHWDGCQECQKLDEYLRPSTVCPIMFELHREYSQGNDFFRLEDRTGRWIYDGKPIPGWRWDSAHMEWVKR
jgi:hypothetical protein